MDSPPATVLDLVPIFTADQRELIGRLTDGLERTFHISVRPRNPWFDPEAAYDMSRGQYNSKVLLKFLLDDPSEEATRVIGVTGVDLFAPVLTYVFGEAQLDGRAAVVSYHRLRPQAYGLAADETLVFRRLLTEAVHELGHTFALLHCRDASCVMHASTYVEEIDLKSPGFCTDCLRLLARRRPSLQNA